MLSDEETTLLQFAIDADDAEEVRRLIERESGEELTERQFYINSTVLMYACQRSKPEIVKMLLEKGVSTYELPYSDNNELKSAVRNKHHAVEVVKLLLEALPQELLQDMIVSDWDPEGEGSNDYQSALELAEDKPEVKQLLLSRLS